MNPPQHIRGSITCGVWSKVSSPNLGTNVNFLNGVAAISSTDVWAVGEYGNGIAAVSGSNVWVVGDDRTSLDPDGPYFTFIEHWNGSAWSVVKSPSPGSQNDLAAVTRVPATTGVWTVGFQQTNTIYQTLTEFDC